MIDQDILTELSKLAVDAGLRVLQGYRFGLTDREHMARLLEYMAPEYGSRWVDMGCGFGEPARILHELRPDLSFFLVNNNRFQLDQVPEELPVFLAEMEELPFNDGTMDGVMFLFSLCQATFAVRALEEAARVVRPRGQLFVFDYMRLGGEGYLARQQLAAEFMDLAMIKFIADFTGWGFQGCDFPPGSDVVMRSLFLDQKLYDRIFDDLVPVIWWARKR